MVMKGFVRISGVLLAVLCLPVAVSGYDVTEHLKPETFLHKVYGDALPGISLLPMRGDLREQVEAVLGHPYKGMRLRYWQKDGTTAWILDEKSKDRPMTIGIGVNPAGEIAVLELLVYREPRGGEVHQAGFRQQYLGATLTDQHTLSREVDGITGATLSVDAMNRVAAVVLLLHRSVIDKDG